MSIRRRKFLEGIRLKSSSNATTLEGEIRLDPSALKFKAYVDSAERSIVTEDQTQTLSSKSIDADNNTITNLETDNLKAGVLITDISTASSDTELPSALAVKTALAGQNEASEITYDNSTSGLTATDVQAAVDEVEGRVDTVEGAASANASGLSNHLADAVDAHDASAISNVPSGNLAATDVQGALNELQTDVDTRALASDLSDHLADATDAHDASAISYDNATSGLTATEVQSAVDEVEGRLDTVEGVASTNVSGLATHISDTSTHGVTGDIVGTSDAQVITAKDIDGGTASNTSRITIPKNTKTNLDGLTRKEATIVFGSDTKKAYIDDGTTLNEIGSGGGGLDVFYTEDYEVTTSSDFTTGNAAAPDAVGTGTINSTIANETVNQIAGTRSIKLTNNASGTNDFIIIGTDIAVEEKQGNNDIGINFYFEYDGNDDDIRFFVLDQDDVELTSSVEFIKASATAKRFSTSVYVPSGTTGLRYGFQVVTGNAGAILLFDDVEFTMNPFVYKNLSNDTNAESYSPTLVGFGTTTNDDFIYSYNGEYLEITGSFTSGTPTATEAQIPLPTGDIVSSKISSIKVVGDAIKTTASSSYPQFHILATAGDSFLNIGRYDNVYNGLVPRDGDLLLASGETLSFRVRVLVEGRSATTENVITPAKSTRVVVRGAGNGGESITANVTDIPFTEVEDTNGLWDGDSFTADSDGDYLLNGRVRSTTTLSALAFYIDGTFDSFIGYEGTASDMVQFTHISKLQKGQVGSIRSDSSFTLNNLDTAHNLQIIKIASEASLLAAIPTPKTCYIKDVKASGTAGGTFTSGAWQTRDLNTLEGDTGFVSLSSNQFTLSSGVYEIEVTAPVRGKVNQHKAKLRNITDSTDDIIGDSYISGTTDVSQLATVRGRIEISSSKTFEIQHRCSTTKATDGFGIAASFGVNEIYSIVKITKVK